MKTLFKFLSLAVVLTALATIGFAQEKPDLETLFTQFKKEGPKTANCGNRGAALVTGKLILQHHGDDRDNKPVIDFVKERMALIEKDDPKCLREQAYNKAFKDKNWAGFMAAGKAIIAAEGADAPVSLDVLLDMISAGYDRSATAEKNEQYAAETVANSKIALQKCQAGKPSLTTKYGVFLPFNTKEDCVSWMYYIQAHFSDRAGQKKEQLGYLFKAAQVGEKKSEIAIFTTIGQFYFDEADKLYNKYVADRKANDNVETDELKTLLGMSRGNADRSIDAFGRAYKMASADPTKAAAKAGLLKTLTGLYKFRFNLPETQKIPELETYVASQIAKPMPDPLSEVVPVIEEVKPPTTPTTTTTTTTTPTTTTTTTTTPTTTPKPATTTPVKPATTPAKPTSTTPATKAATSKAVVKKPVAKKKGTR